MSRFADGFDYVYPAQAAEEARRWAVGAKSHLNEMMQVEPGVDQRQVTLALTAFMDAQEVVKFSALAQALAVTPMGRPI